MKICLRSRRLQLTDSGANNNKCTRTASEYHDYEAINLEVPIYSAKMISDPELGLMRSSCAT